MPRASYDLSQFSFNPWFNVVSVTDTVAPPTDGSTVRGLFTESDDTVAASGGTEVIGAVLELDGGTVDNADGTIIGFSNEGSLETGRGIDAVGGNVFGTVGDDATLDVAGIRSPGRINSGDHADAIEGLVALKAGRNFSGELAGLDLTGDGSDGDLITGGGHDAVLGAAALTAGDYDTDSSSLVAGILSFAEDGFDTGSGNDVVKGIASFSGGEVANGAEVGVAAVGLVAPVHTGAGTDWVGGHASATMGDAEAGSSIQMFAIGISSEGSIVTGSGADTIVASAEATVGVGGVLEEVLGVGADIDAGSGGDTVLIAARATSGNISEVRGTQSQDIALGEGKDWLTVSASASGMQAGAIALEETVLDAGSGDDTVSASATANGNIAEARGFFDYNDASTLGDGADNLFISTGAFGGEKAIAIGYELQFATFDAGDGSDVIRIDGQAVSQGDATAEGLNILPEAAGFPSAFLLGDGDDRLEIAVSAEATGPTGVASAVGLQATDNATDPDLDAGAGNDLVDIRATAVGADAEAYALRAVDIFLGEGNDTLRLEAATAGMIDAVIEGGLGDDTFDIGSGTGEIWGDNNSGDEAVDELDTLALDGEFAEFVFIAIGDGDDVNISDGGATDLDVYDVEAFVFAGVTFGYGDLVA